MGSIANKRGSVRQAPPDIYLPFLSSDDENDVGIECEQIAIDFGFFFLLAIILYGVIVCWRGIRSIF